MRWKKLSVTVALWWIKSCKETIFGSGVWKCFIQKAKGEKTRGGRPMLQRLSAAKMKAFEALKTKPRVSGILTGTEVGMKT